jgi:hypothetical protein
MYLTRPFNTISLFPFCLDNDPKTLYLKDTCALGSGVPIDITNSTINTTRKSLDFYWRLRTLTVTLTVQNLFADPEEGQIFTATTELDVRKNYDTDLMEPYQRVCLEGIGYNGFTGGFPFRAGSIDPKAFAIGDEIALHYEYIPLIMPAYGDSGVTEDVFYFGITTLNEDYGFECEETLFLDAIDQTIPITLEGEDDFGPYTLYVKYVAAPATAERVLLIDAVVDEYTYYTIEEE